MPTSAWPWRWIPTLYFAQALPNAAAATLSVVMYKNLGLSNTEIALYTSWLYLPWVIKPLWSPLVNLFGSKRGWTVALQFIVGVAFALVALTLPASNFLQLALAWAQPGNLWLVGSAIVVEQFGYGFGFTAYLVYMLMVSSQDGEHRSAHYAICTGFMALGMMLPGMAAGWLQSQMGYTLFFVWVCVATLPSFTAAALLQIDPAFGQRQ